MNRILFTATLLVAFFSANCQPAPARGEFATNNNGLMYSDADMMSLRFIVDSLNLRFKTCDLSKPFYSNPQTRVFYIRFRSPKNDLKNIIKDIKSKTSYAQLITKYASFLHSVDTTRLIIYTGKKQNPEDDDKYIEGTPGEGYETVYLDEKFKTKEELIENWSLDYQPKKDEFWKEYDLTCRYFPEPWNVSNTPDKYGRLIQYVDCMIDTSAYVFLTDKFSGGWFSEDEKSGYHNLSDINTYLNKKMPPGNKPGNNKQLSEAQLSFAAKELKTDEQFRSILSKTIDDYVKNKEVNYQLESLAGELEMYDKALLMKRCYRIMGSCSQDTRPREHARDIAILAAQAHSWDIFLRAHLDIMNDRFDRMSDGSYAWGNRKTYLKELEELNLNIVDLMLGLTLRAQNVAGNHYYGTIWRMGWALTESKEKNIFEEKALAMMKDTSLDEFNRGLIFLLYHTYTNYLDEKEGKQKREELRKNISSFPDFIQASIKQIKEPDKKSR